MAYLAAAQRYCLTGARGEEGQAGVITHRAQPRGCRVQAARRRRAHPLGSAHAGEGAGDGAMPPAPPSLLSASHSVTVVAVLRKGERATREKRERNEAKRERAGKNELGFSSGARCVEFYSKRNARVAIGSGWTAESASDQNRPRRGGTFLA